MGSMANELRLRPLRPKDEAAALAAHRALGSDDSLFLLDYRPGEPWPVYLQRLEDQSRGIALPPGWVPCSLLVGVVDGVVVGRVSIRYELNDFLQSLGGHIGYAVLPDHRRRGHATEMLRQALVIARSRGIDSVLVTCDDDNIGSAKVIEHCGGVLDGLVEQPEKAVRKRRYWIH